LLTFRSGKAQNNAQLFGTPGQSSKEGLRPSVDEGLRAIQAKANLLAGPYSGRHYLLTDPRQFGILQFGPGWRGTECNSTNRDDAIS
jgi:hypothetical protein